MDCKKEKQRRRAIEGVVDITKLCLMEMDQEELANTLGSGKRTFLLRCFFYLSYPCSNLSSIDAEVADATVYTMHR